MNIFRRIGIGILILALAFPVFAADEVRTSVVLNKSSFAEVTSALAVPFTLYVGDNVTAVTQPLKSIYFSISGVYTGSGTFSLNIDSIGATTRTFTLPVVTTPTPFELIYSDSTGSISITSGGSYNHTLNVTPSSVSIYGLSIKNSETHRYTQTTCPDGAPTNQKIKTNQFSILSSNTSISANLTTPFTLYIGDNITGVNNAIKSAYFKVSGLYTGSGTVAFTLNNVPASTKTVSLPSVSSPTSFEYVYNDSTGIIKPTSAGTYSYSIGTVPSGIMISGLAITLFETHQYKPSACASFPAKGELYSAVFDTTGTSTGPAYNSILWKGILGGPGENLGHVRFQLATSDCPNGASNYPTCSSGTWTFIGGLTCSSLDWFDSLAADTPFDLQSTTCLSTLNNKRYFRYAVEICSFDCSISGSYTPRVDDVVVNWSP
jgi:hypothetical protein